MIERAKEQFNPEKERIATIPLFKDRRDQFAHGRSFVKSDEIDPLIFFKKATERIATGAGAIHSFGIKRGENCPKHTKN